MKSFSGKKVNTAVFISGTGSNFKNLLNFSLKKSSPIKIIFVYSNFTKAKGLKYAKNNKIHIYSFVNKKFNLSENKLLKILNKKKIKLICLAGFMKILSKRFLKKFNGCVLNIHPSLLPKYKGLNTHQRVLDNREKYSGCTVHLVTSKLDSGKIILQKKIKVKKNDSARSLKRRILKEEHKIYPKAINKLLVNY